MADTPSVDIEHLIAEHSDRLYRYAYRLTGTAADAEDLTQQTFLIAYQKLDQLRDPETARSWLLTILRHAFIAVCKKRVPTDLASLDLKPDQIPEELPEELEIDREQLQQAINELPEEFRLVLVSYYFEDCSYREIAEQLGVPIGTVMSRLSRAKGFLRARLFPIDSVSAPEHGAALPGRRGG